MSESKVFTIFIVFAVSLLLGFLVPTAAVQAQSGLSGVWEIKLDTQTGEQIWIATFDESGGSIAGEIDMNDGEGVLPIEGTVDGNMIKWGFVVPDLDGDMPINLSGEIQGGTTINGDEGSFVWYGTGVWSGTKQ
ncbi:MAG: hypothetical protein VX262_04055 [Acidobacteriota bacterium]|nr:hypothetical protein [Acidobacteriota bacterium]